MVSIGGGRTHQTGQRAGSIGQGAQRYHVASGAGLAVATLAGDVADSRHLERETLGAECCGGRIEVERNGLAIAGRGGKKGCVVLVSDPTGRTATIQLSHALYGLIPRSAGRGGIL